MPPRVIPGPVQDNACIREAVCVHTRKIYDSCRDKDCLEDLRLYLTSDSQAVIDTNCASIRARTAELLYATIDVEEVTFNRGFYSVNVRYFYKITGDAYTLVNRASEICGLAIFDKRVILFGSEGNAKIFSSDTVLGSVDQQAVQLANRPTAVVEAVDPIVLSMKVLEPCAPACEYDMLEVPDFVIQSFDSPLIFDSTARRVYATLGQFSIIRLERDSQLLIPAYDYCMPDKECVGCGDDDPCTLFSRINFPVDEFFPPDTLIPPEGYREAVATLNK